MTTSTSHGIKGKGDCLAKSFYTLELFDNNTEYERNLIPGTSLGNYEIEYAQFCQQPLDDVFADFIVTVIKIPEFVFLRVPHKIADAVTNNSNEIIPGLPSGHHRFIRFRTSQYFPSTQNKVWGTMERLGDGVICALYANERASFRTESSVTQNGSKMFFPESLDMDVSKRVEEIFRGIGGGWKGNYHFADNNCIHYAIECWKRLGGNVKWNDVVDGQSSILPDRNDPSGRRWPRCIVN